MTPAILHLDGRLDPVLCDCGQELRRLYTTELPPETDRHLFGGVLLAVELEESSSSFEGDRLSRSHRVTPVRPPAETLRASGVCSACGAFALYEFSFNGEGVVVGTEHLTTAART